MVEVYNPSTQEKEAEGSHIQSLNGPRSEFEARLDNSMRLLFQNESLKRRLGVSASGKDFA